MANQQHLDILKQGVDVWNKWRKEHPEVRPDLSKADLFISDLTWANLQGADISGATLVYTRLNHADLSYAELNTANLTGATLGEAKLKGTDFSGADLRQVNLREIDLTEAKLWKANLSEVNFSGRNLQGMDFRGADLSRADFHGANLCRTNFSEADLRSAKFSANLNHAELEELYQLDSEDWIRINIDAADLHEANLRRASLNEVNLSGVNLEEANLSEADLSEANLNKANCYGANFSKARLNYATLVETNLEKADLTGCSVYGISAWKVQLDGAIQSNLIITPDNEPAITVDNLEVAQFIYLLLNNKGIREVIDTITSKVVLILGRFIDERKAVLDALRNELRRRNYSPVLFDFEKPASRDITETISTLAHMARFVIADITDAKSIPQELQVIVPNLPSVPIQPLLQASERKYGMFEHFTRYPWVLPIYYYTDQVSLLQSLKENIIEPVERKAQELIKR